MCGKQHSGRRRTKLKLELSSQGWHNVLIQNVERQKVNHMSMSKAMTKTNSPSLPPACLPACLPTHRDTLSWLLWDTDTVTVSITATVTVNVSYVEDIVLR